MNDKLTLIFSIIAIVLWAGYFTFLLIRRKKRQDERKRRPRGGGYRPPPDGDDIKERPEE